MSALNVLDTSYIGVDIVFLDVKMPGMGGMEALKKIKEIAKNIPVIIMTAFSDSDTAIEAMKKGAFDYLTKPVDGNQLKEVIEKALASARLQKEASFCIETDNISDKEDTIIGKSQAILDMCKMIGQVAETDVSVLISGESGVGKELVARAIYNHSARKGKPFMAVNCAALAEGVVESELFGCEKGAFTGAEKRRIGRFEQCDMGTIFLDEIGDMTLSTQAKLLRVLQDGGFDRVGSNETMWTDVRVIAASNKNLHDEVRNGRFRDDLFHRLNVFSIHILPLRERKVDIPVLSEYFLQRAARETGRQIKGFSQNAISLLISHHWPGNVRELENVIKRATVIAGGEILDVNDFVLDTGPSIKESHDLTVEAEPLGKESQEFHEVIDELFNATVKTKNTPDVYHSIIASVEKRLIENALGKTNGNQLHASALLGISRVTLRKKMQYYDITSE
jgi:DNA-binding NtrC family response regulator